MYIRCMTSSNSKTFVFVHPHVNKKQAFSKISSLESVFEKMRFRWSFSPDTCGQKAKPKENISVFDQKRIRVGWRGIIVKPNLYLKQVPVYPVPYQSPVPPSTSPKPKSPVAPADDIQLPPIGFNRKTQPNGYWTPPPKYDDIFARRSRPPSSPQKVPKNSLAHLLCLLWSLKKHYSRTFLVFKLIVIFRLNLRYEICIGNSMICSDIWHKYHEWYFEIVIRNFTSR